MLGHSYILVCLSLRVELVISSVLPVGLAVACLVVALAVDEPHSVRLDSMVYARSKGQAYTTEEWN